MRKWILPGIVSIIVVIYLFTSTSEKGRNSEDTLVIGIARDWRVSDVWSHKGFNCLVFETLISRDEKRGYVPLLAKSWEKSEDGMCYTFHIRKGIMFSDATPLTAQLVKESFGYREKGRNRVKSIKGGPGNNRRENWFDNETYNLPRWSAIKSIDVLDDYTVRFNLRQPYTLFLDELATTHMSPILKPSQDEEVTGFIGTGPYRIIKHKRTQYLLLAKNSEYWQGKVNIPKIILKVIPDAQTRAIALEAGNIDLTGIDHFDKIPLEVIPELKNQGLQVERLSSVEPAVSYLVLNYQSEPFTDPHTRKAIYLAIDRGKIDSIIHESAGSIAGPVPEGHSLCNPRIKDIERDLDEAGRLLAEAGWKDGNGDGILDKDGNNFSVTLSFNYFDPLYKIIAEIIQAQLKDAGIDVKLRLVELGAHVSMMRNKKFEMAFWPQMRYHMFYYSRHIPWLNLYQSAELDDAFDNYLHSSNSEESQAAAYITQELIVESYVMPFFFENYSIAAWNNKKLKNFKPLPLGWNLCVDLWKAKLADE